MVFPKNIWLKSGNLSPKMAHSHNSRVALFYKFYTMEETKKIVVFPKNVLFPAFQK